MQGEISSKPIPEWLLRQQPVAYRPAVHRSWSINGILAAITVALLIAASITFYLRPANSASAFAYAAPASDEVADTVEDDPAPQVKLAEREFVTERSIEWVRGSVDIPYPPKPAIESAHAAEWQSTVPIGTSMSRTESTGTPRTVPTTVAHVNPSQVKPVAETPKAVIAKKVQQTAAPIPRPAHPCGTIQNCIAASARDPNMVHVMHACRSVLNGGGSAQSRVACDSIFGISVPGESDIPDDQREKAAAICRGMPKCTELVKKRPSAAQLVRACGIALVRGAGPAADTCDRAVMSRI